jgi:surfactin synthase thioesterase subunit
LQSGQQGKFRLVCLPHAGASAGYYFALSRLLAPGIEVLAVQYPGRQDRRSEPFIDNVPQLADGVTTALSGWMDRPYAIFGHSLGALLGFEVARRLERTESTKPMWLFASGRRGPATRRNERVHLLDDSGLLAELRRLAGTDQRFLDDPELREMVLPPTRNDYRAVESYEFSDGPPLSCPITVLTGSDDPKTTIDEASAWARHTTGTFQVRTYPGGHFFLDDHRTAVAREISNTLTARAGVAS